MPTRDAIPAGAPCWIDVFTDDAEAAHRFYGELADKEYGPAIKQFGDMVPVAHNAQPADIANVMRFMLSDDASYVCGSVFFVDGGSDAMLRPDDF